jgi:hypothetical protein
MRAQPAPDTRRESGRPGHGGHEEVRPTNDIGSAMRDRTGNKAVTLIRGDEGDVVVRK